MRRNGNGIQDGIVTSPTTAVWIPIAAGGCIALIIGLIAAAIVLSLIPVYLPTRTVTYLNQTCSAKCKSGCTQDCLRLTVKCNLTSTNITIVTVNDQPPFISQTGNAAPIGFDVDLMSYIASIYQITFTYQYAQFSDLISTVQNNTNMISISTQTDTSEREQSVNFAQFFQTGSSFIVLNNYTNSITNLSDLCGQKVVVVSTSIQQDDVITQNSSCTATPITLQVVPSITDLISYVTNGIADVGLYDDALLTYYATQSNNTLKVVGTTYDVQPYGIVCNKQNEALCCLLVNGINYLIKNGTYETLLNKYSFSYKNNGVCPSTMNINGTTCLSTCSPSDSYCSTKLS